MCILIVIFVVIFLSQLLFQKIQSNYHSKNAWFLSIQLFIFFSASIASFQIFLSHSQNTSILTCFHRARFCALFQRSFSIHLTWNDPSLRTGLAKMYQQMRTVLHMINPKHQMKNLPRWKHVKLVPNRSLEIKNGWNQLSTEKNQWVWIDTNSN